MEESSFKLYERLLRLGSDWKIVNINVDDNQDEIHVTVEYRHKEWIDKTTGKVFLSMTIDKNEYGGIWTAWNIPHSFIVVCHTLKPRKGSYTPSI